ncbi:MAG: helix-turn-helix domain-containing protein [Bacteroidaceae bacterium]|nr:helix-turn-helix domain-containing protein [Bacteroidaceae bacterium]
MTLQEIRIKRGLSQSQLAEKAGVKLRTLQHYEQGTKNIDGAKLHTLLNIADALNCPLTAILKDEELKSKAKRVTL